MSKNLTLKGRATAAFGIVSDVTDGILTIVVTADATSGDYGFAKTSAAGIGELGREVAELGKAANPITAAQRRFDAAVDEVVNTLGVTEAQATATLKRIAQLG